MIRKNYFFIDDAIEVSEVLNSLDILYKDGIVLIIETPNKEIVNALSAFVSEVSVDFPNDAKSTYFSFFPPKKLKLHSTAVQYNSESKDILLKLADAFIPAPEFCSCIYYLKQDGNNILKWTEDSIFVSRDAVPSDKVFRKFCKALGIFSYSVEQFA